MRIPGGPPLEAEDWIAFYSEKETTAICDEAPGIASLEEDMSLVSIYGTDEVPMFGPQYGGFSRKRNYGIPSGSTGTATHEPTSTVYNMASGSRDQIYNGSTSTLIHENYDIPRFGPRHGGLSLSSSSRTDQIGSSSTSKVKVGVQKLRFTKLSGAWSTKSDKATKPIQTSPQTPCPPGGLTSRPSCIVCTEEFSGTTIPPKWISQNCVHPPTVCSDCLVKCIKSDLDTKVWNQIKCPECGILLIYDDIRQLADRETFLRWASYHLISYTLIVTLIGTNRCLYVALSAQIEILFGVRIAISVSFILLENHNQLFDA